MSERPAGFFDEAPGEKSMSRLLAFGCWALAAAVVARWCILGGAVEQWLIAQLLMYAMAFKHGGRALENRE
jgi:hypothetical protein